MVCSVRARAAFAGGVSPVGLRPGGVAPDGSGTLQNKVRANFRGLRPSPRSRRAGPGGRRAGASLRREGARRVGPGPGAVRCGARARGESPRAWGAGSSGRGKGPRGPGKRFRVARQSTAGPAGIATGGKNLPGKYCPVRQWRPAGGPRSGSLARSGLHPTPAESLSALGQVLETRRRRHQGNARGAGHPAREGDRQ